MKRKSLFLLSFIINCFLMSQNESSSDIWYFGQNAGMKFINKSPVIQIDGAINTWEGTGSIEISNSCYFYSDGTHIYNKNNNKLKNILLNGNKSATQGVLFTKHIYSDSILFLLTTTLLDYQECPLYFYKLKILNDTNLTLIESKLINRYGSEKMNMVNHENGIDKWIITHTYFNNNYQTYFINKDGLQACNNNIAIGTNYLKFDYANAGQIKFSPSGKFVAASTFSLHYIDLFKFNNKSGLIYDSISLYILRNYGIEFSKNERFLYVSDLQGNLRQYDLSVWNVDIIKASEKVITNKGIKKISALQLATDGKIYWSNNDSFYLAAIEEPDKQGDSCKLNFRSIYLQGKKCAYGLPSFNQSEFYTPAIDFKYELECINNTVQFWGYDTFNARVHQWEIRKLKGGNWQSIGQDKNLNYTFTDTGLYEVRYVAAINSRQDTVSKTIHIYQKINKHFLGKDTIYAKGTPFKKQLSAPYGMHCQLWQDGSGLSTFQADTAGRYTCKVINQSFCEVTDTIDIKECINSLTVPSIFRIKDSLYTYQQVADSFIWFKNNVQFKITKASSIKLTDTGTYRVEAAKKAHCNRSSANFRIEKLSLHKLNSQAIGIKIYPNPANEKVFIEANTDFSLLVTDATGKTILEAENIKELTLPNGIYYFRLTVNNTNYFEKVVVLN